MVDRRHERAGWRRLGAAAAAALLAACGGGGEGGDPAAGTEPVAVAGQWSGLTDLRNPGEARLLGCTADLRRLDGLLAATVGPQCDVVEPASVVQDGEAFTIVRDALLCGDAVVRGQSGGGTVTGDDVRGALDLIGPDEVRTRHFRGTVEGRRVTLTFDRLSVDGLASGTCLISPPLRAEVVILP